MLPDRRPLSLSACWLLALSFVALTGCASRYRIDASSPTGASGSVLASAYRAEQARRAQADGQPPPTRMSDLPAGHAALASARTVYFGYDSFVVDEDYRAMLQAHANSLRDNPERRLVIEGHTDERGGSEYNLALGQKRADAVRESLVLLGAPEGRLEAVSYGKERPADKGSGEAAWARNRRAELKEP